MARPNPTTADLPIYSVLELDKYIERVGANWKDTLAHDWSRAGTRVHGIEYGYLHTLRNAFGPSWLEGYEHDHNHGRKA